MHENTRRTGADRRRLGHQPAPAPPRRAGRRSHRRGRKRRRHRHALERPRSGLRAAGAPAGPRCRRSWRAWSAAGRAGARRPMSPARRRRRRSPRGLLRFATRGGRPDRDRAGRHAVTRPRDGDVIRGEETQIVGLLDREPGFDGLAILPGTHSKWATVSAARSPGSRPSSRARCSNCSSRHSFLRHSVADRSGGDLSRSRISRWACAGRPRRACRSSRRSFRCGCASS